MRFVRCLCFLVALTFLCSSYANAQNVYVSSKGDDARSGRTRDEAVATLERARDIARTMRGESSDERTIVLLDDIAITKPLVLTPEDSHVTFTSAKGVVATISGGRRITGWTRGENNVWTVDLPEVQAGQWRFRQLFADGDKLQRAKTPNDGFLRVAGFPDGAQDVHYHTDCKRFEYAVGDIDPNWHNLQDVEVIVYHFWTDSHVPIASIDVENRIVTFQHKAGKVFTDDFSSDGARYIVENVLEGLDQPGEWYLDRRSGRLHLMLKEGEDPNTVKIMAPVAPTLVRIEGQPLERKYVERVCFDNLRFEYTNFDLPRGNSNDRQGSASVPAAIVFKGAKDCSIMRCAVENTGTWAIEIGEGCESIDVQRCVLDHIGAGAIRIDGGDWNEHPLLRTRSSIVACNEITHYGDEFPSAVGVLLMNTSGNHVACNEIAHGYYTGVSVGWQWGYQRSVARDNKVMRNHIHHIGQGLLSDMGGVYTLGISPGTEISGNVIHDVEANHYGGWGIYNDEGSSHMLIEKNLVYRTKFAPYNIHFAKEVTVRNNIFALGRLEQLTRGRAEPHKSCFFENNIVYWTDGPLYNKNWKDAPYTFHFHPKNATGTREMTSTFDADYNLYFNPTKKLAEVDFNGRTWEEWNAAGKDRHSVYSDPLFVDPENGDFRLKENSPAWGLGFEDLPDAEEAGPSGQRGPSAE